MTVAIETSNLQELGLLLSVDVGGTLKIKRVVKSCVIELLTQGNYLMAHILMALEKVVGEKGINPAKLNKNRNLIDESHQVRQFLRLKAQLLQKVCKVGVYLQIPSLQSNLGFLECSMRSTLEQEGFFYKANHINQVLDVVGEKLEGANFYTPFVRYDLHSKGKNHSFIVLVQDLEMATAKNHQGTAFYPLEMAVFQDKPFEPLLPTKLDEINEQIEVLLTFLDEKVR